MVESHDFLTHKWSLKRHVVYFFKEDLKSSESGISIAGIKWLKNFIGSSDQTTYNFVATCVMNKTKTYKMSLGTLIFMMRVKHRFQKNTYTYKDPIHVYTCVFSKVLI